MLDLTDLKTKEHPLSMSKSLDSLFFPFRVFPSTSHSSSELLTEPQGGKVNNSLLLIEIENNYCSSAYTRSGLKSSYRGNHLESFF